MRRLQRNKISLYSCYPLATKRSHSADVVFVAKWLEKNKCKIQKLQRGVQGIVVPHLSTVVFAGLPIVITEIESVGGFDDFLFAQAGA